MLAGGSADTASLIGAALQQGPALQRQLQSTLLVSSRDAMGAALAAPALGHLAVTSFLAASHAAGVDLAGGGTMARLNQAERQLAAAGRALHVSGGSSSEGEGEEAADDDAGAGDGTASGWLSSLLQRWCSTAAAEQLGAAANQVVHSGLANWVTLRNAFAHLGACAQS